MQVTRASEYAMLGLLALARRPLESVAMVDAIAQEEGIPTTFLSKIFQSLAKVGILRSVRGSGGGFALLRSADEITILEVIEAVEGPIAFQRCLEPESDCTHRGGCALCGLFTEAQDRVKEVFARTTVGQLSKRHTSFADYQAVQALSGPKHPRAKARSSKTSSRKLQLT